MNNSYIKEFKNSFPEIHRPFTEEQLARFEANCALQPQTIYIAKSNKAQELERELAEVNALYRKVTKAAACWVETKNGKVNLDYKVPTFIGPHLPYAKYKMDGTYDVVQTKLEAVTDMAKSAANRMGSAILTLQNTLDVFKEKIQRDIEIEQKGLAGENEVEQYISRKLDCRVLSNVVLPEVRESDDAPKTSETDLLIISDTGVYVCEIKNYGKAGQTLEVRPNGQIIKKDYYGRELENMGSPFAQNARHAKAVRSVLETAGLGNMPVYSVVIIANTDVNVENNSPNIVTDMYGFCDIAAKGFYGATCTAEQQSAIFTAIQAKRMTERKFPFLSISPVTETMLCTCIEAEAAVQGYEQWVEKIAPMIVQWNKDVEDVWERNNKEDLKYRRFSELIQESGVIVIFSAFVFWIFLIVYMFMGKCSLDRAFTVGVFGTVFTIAKDMAQSESNTYIPATQGAVSLIVMCFIGRIMFSLIPVVFVLLCCYYN